MPAGKKLHLGENIIVSKWLQDMWELEEKHPITTGSLLSSKGWVPDPQRKKVSSIKRPTKKPAVVGLSKRGASNLVTADGVLAAIVGKKPAARSTIGKKVWKYIKTKGLQSSGDTSVVKTDAKLHALFGKSEVAKSEVGRLISKHFKA